MAKTMPSMTRRIWRGGRRERRRWKRRGEGGLVCGPTNQLHGIVKRLCIYIKPPEYD